ncbi:MAG: phosphoglucosamine mutase [Robiginitomaculum sp.]|nr:MAG: phosphoglucosamine mutase [Robiginitomaculum sp.]
MNRIKFGTDGIRGLAGTAPIDADTARKVGFAAGQVLADHGTAFMARDPRQSGPMLETALAEGLCAAGTEVQLGGIMPTAALALAIQSQQADLGVMITASHNPARDNGIKLFASGGSKISDAQQAQMETIINQSADPLAGKPAKAATITDNNRLADPYLALVHGLITGWPLHGIKLVVDCANGAASCFAPMLLAEAGAEIVSIHHQPDGTNINLNCGSTHPQSLQQRVLSEQAHAGIAFDGDADRVLLVDETGGLIDGDQILARLATDWKAKNKLAGKSVVATVMSNGGLATYLSGLDVHLERSAVGDRHVADRMAEIKANLGGEQSGHILLPEILPSGDGLIAGLLPLLGLAASGQLASQYLRPFEPLPQLLHNVRHTGGNPLIDLAVKTAIRKVVQQLGKEGRVLVRASGTEPLIRIMAEANTLEMAQSAIDQIAAAIVDAG